MKISKLSRAVFLTSIILLTSPAVIFADEISQKITENTVETESEKIAETASEQTEEEQAETVSEEISDQYEEEKIETLSEEISEPDTASVSENSDAKNSDSLDEYVESTLSDSKKKNAKKGWNPFAGMFETKQKKYIFYDQIKLATGTIGYSIKPRTAEVFVDPKTKKAGIQVYYQSSFFDFLFDENNIALIAEGYEKYLEDFNAHRLIKKNSMKTRKMYTNKGKCRTEWGSVKIMINYYGDSQFHVGYEFKKNSPYFCIIIKDCKNIATDIGSNVPEKSVEVQLYFTKAEAKQFLDSLSRETVMRKLNESDEYGLELSTDSDY